MGLKYFVETSLPDALRRKLGVGWYERGRVGGAIAMAVIYGLQCLRMGL
ncbi:MAG: hypothetical protein ACPL7O_03760 [Armatimonadota bacterium]